MIRESAVERRLVDKLRAVDPRILVLKFRVLGHAGFHDRLVLLPRAIPLFVELKRPGETPRKLQVYRHRQIARLGIASMVVDTLERVDEFADYARRIVEGGP